MTRSSILRMARLAVKHKRVDMARRVVHEARLAGMIRIAMSMEEARITLGFKPYESPSEQEIMKAWREMALKNHPDRGGDAEIMQTVNVAKDVLLGKEKPSSSTYEDTYEKSPSQQYRRRRRQNPNRRRDKYNNNEEDKTETTSVLDFNSARSQSISGVNWRFCSNAMYDIDMTDKAKKISNSRGCVSAYYVYGTKNNKHVFMLVEDLTSPCDKNFGVSSWSMNSYVMIDIDIPLINAIKQGFKSLWVKATFAGSLPEKKAFKYYPCESPLTENMFSNQKGSGYSLKAITDMVGTGV